MSNAMTMKSDVTPWYKQRWPWLLMAGPAVVIVAGITTAWLAVVSNDGLVTDDYYKQGLAVNQQLHREQQASAFGLRADVMRSGENMRVLLAGKEGMTFPETLKLRLAHPTRAGQDQIVALVSEGQGFYTGKLTAEIAGRWLVTIEDPAGQWRLFGEWLADSGEPLRLTAKAEK